MLGVAVKITVQVDSWRATCSSSAKVNTVGFDMAALLATAFVQVWLGCTTAVCPWISKRRLQPGDARISGEAPAPASKVRYRCVQRLGQRRGTRALELRLAHRVVPAADETFGSGRRARGVSRAAPCPARRAACPAGGTARPAAAAGGIPRFHRSPLPHPSRCCRHHCPRWRRPCRLRRCHGPFRLPPVPVPALPPVEPPLPPRPPLPLPPVEVVPPVPPVPPLFLSSHASAASSTTASNPGYLFAASPLLT